MIGNLPIIESKPAWMSDAVWQQLLALEPDCIASADGDFVVVELRDGLTFGVCAGMVPVQSTIDALHSEVSP